MHKVSVVSDQARPPRMKFPKIEGSPLLSNDEVQALRAVLLGLDPTDTNGNPPSLDIWLAARDFYVSRSPEAVEQAAKAVKRHLRAAYYPMPVNQELPPTMEMRLRGDAEKIARAAFDATSEKEDDLSAPVPDFDRADESMERDV